jgi:UDP-glucuronate 4-epimerase
MPFAEHHPVDHPISLYGATKRANELMAHSYASLYNLPVTGLRFFTVYGPWGRPDMALFKFTQNILTGTPIEVYNHGKMIRDFTYIDDIVYAIMQIIDRPATPDLHWDKEKLGPATSYAPYRIYNIGNSEPVLLSTFIKAIENAVGKSAIIKSLPMQAGDVPATHADVSKLCAEFDFKPSISINEGINSFVQWYRDYFRVEDPDYA